MCGLQALRIALDLRHVPSRVHHIRSGPLPEGVPLLLRIAAGDPGAEQQALTAFDRSVLEIREAAEFFIEQILFAPDTNSYRVLGATPDASMAELRRNMALLMRWLHPDTDNQSERGVFVGRVTSAWDDLKTTDRRAAYDSSANKCRTSARSDNGRPHSPKKPRPGSKRRRNGARKHAPIPAKSRSLAVYRPERMGLLGRVLSLLTGRRGPERSG